MNLIRLFNFFFIIFCALGFCIQSCFVFMEYFSFKIYSKIAPIVPTSHKVPDLSICFSLTSIIDQKELNKSSSPRFFDDQSTIDHILSMTTDEIFFSTPDATDLIDMCSYSNNLFDAPKNRIWRESCLKYFDVSKYQMLSYMCYRVTIAASAKQNIKTIDFEKVANAVEDKHKLYSISLHHPTFAGGSKKFLPIVHVSEMPYESRQFTTEFLSHPKENNSFRLNYDLFTVARLPAPYETMCRAKDPIQCYYDCLSNKSMPLNIKPEETVLTNQTVKLKIVTDSDRTDANISRKMSDIKSKCNEGCGANACNQEYTVTSLVLYPKSKWKLGFKILTAANPVVQIIFTPYMFLTEFLTMEACLLGIWFAASAIGITRVIFSFLPGSKNASKWPRAHSVKVLALFNSVRSLHQKCQSIRERKEDQPNASSSMWLERALDFLAMKRNLCSFAFNFAAFGLFMYHIYSVTELYFAYGTLIMLHREVTEVEHKTLKFVLCFDVQDLFDMPYPKIPDQYDFDQILRDNWTDNTLSQMFQHQFPHSKILSSCGIRNFTSNRMQFYSSFDECSQYIEIETLYMFRLMCYKLSPKFNTSYKHQPIRLAFNDPFTIYSVTAEFSNWRNSHKVRPILYYGFVPGYSRDFALDNYISETNRTYILTYASYYLHLLPKPYDTECAPVGQLDYQMCVVSRTLNELGHLPHSEIYSKSLDKKFLSYSLLVNQTVAELFEEIESYCDEVSRAIMCEDSFTKTISSIEYVTNTNLTYAIQTPIYAITHSKAVPRMTFGEFIFHSACCFSFWFGLSITLFNPFAYFIIKSRRKMSKLNIERLNKAALQLATIFIWLRKTASLPDEISRGSNLKNFLKSKFVKLRERKARILFYNDLIFVVCCFIHLIYLARQYFAYDTVIKSLSQKDNLDIVPWSILCIEAEDILASNLAQSVKVSTLFNLTPPVEHLLDTCGGRALPVEYRSSYPNISNYVLNRLYIENHIPAECTKFFDISKFVMNTNICYRLKFRNKVKSIYNEFRALKYPGFIYDFGIYPNRTFDTYTAIMANEKPFISRLFASKITSSHTDNEWIDISYMKYTTKCLPFPYDQQGYPDMEFDECISLCVANSTRSTGWVFPLVVVNDPKSELKIFNSKTFLHKKTIDHFNRVHESCKSKCKLHRNCDKEFTYYVTISSKGGKWAGLSFWIKRTDYPETKIEFLPQMRLCDLILDAGNIVGIWLGLCVLSFNPFKFLKHYTPHLSEDATDEEIIAKLMEVQTDYQTVKRLMEAPDDKFVLFTKSSREILI